MRTLLAALASSLLACAPVRGPRPADGEIALSVEGKVEGGPLYLTRAEAGRLPRRSFLAREPVTGREVRFEGISLAALLDDQARPEKRADIAVIRARDGGAVDIPLVRIRELSPVLADRAYGWPVAVWAREARVPAETWVLAWPNLDQPGLDSDPRARWWWATGVRRVVLESWLATYGKALRVPAGAPDGAQRGAEDVQLHCMACHRVRGAGGERGPDLTGALKDRTPAAFAGSVRPHALERGLLPGPEGEAALLRIATFLRSIHASFTPTSTDEQAQPEEVPEPPPRPPGAMTPPGH
jgi:mono/diheme cytochrome c family protein